MKDETRQTLMLLVEKAKRLQSFNFAEHVKDVGLGFKGTRVEDDNWVVEFGLPDDEKQDSFILTFRFFYGDRESISFPKLGRLIKDPELSSSWREGVSAARTAYFRYLESYSEYTVELFEGHPSRGEILRTVLYGEMAHADPKKLRRLKQWTTDDIRRNLLHQEFTAILVQILMFIKAIGELSERELEAKPA